MADEDLRLINQDNRSFYERWQENEGLDIIRGMFIEDVRNLPLKAWKRKGGRGVFITLEGSGGENSAYVCEIPPGGTLLPQKHLFEENILILEGRGSTTVWNEGGPKQSFEWQAGSLFSPPLNAWHQHFNAQGSQPALYLAVTLALPMLNIFHNEDFVFNNPYQFKDRFAGEANYFSGKGELLRSFGSRMKIWESNFVSDVNKADLAEWKERGAGGRSLKFELSDGVMTAHMSQFGVGTYKKAHRHGGGAHVLILSGEGFSLMWKENNPIQRYDWKRGSLVVPPEMWFHQHFNVGKEPARYFALHARNSRKHKSDRYDWGMDKSVKEGGDQIEYEDEDPAIRKMFEAELAKRGVESRMPPINK